MRATSLLSRHLVHVVWSQKGRLIALFAALVGGLGVVIGLASFVSSIDASFQERGRAIGGVSDVQVESASQTSTLPASLKRELEEVDGTRYAVPITQQRVTLSRGPSDTVATAIGVDGSARLLRSAVGYQLADRASADPPGGIVLTKDLAESLGDAARNDSINLFAYGRSVTVAVRRVVSADSAVSDVLTVPRRVMETLRSRPGQPTSLYVGLNDGVSLNEWQRRAAPYLPANATTRTVAQSQNELDYILDFTTRAPTLVFGVVVLAIVALLVYVLQMMRMLERQEDIGLLRALGGRIWAQVAAESVILVVLIAAGLLPALFFATLIAEYLAAQVPGYLTDVFGFNMRADIAVKSVVVAAIAVFIVGLAATIAALASVRGTIASLLGRSPQAGATVTSSMSRRLTLSLLICGGALLVSSGILSNIGMYSLAAVSVVLSVALIAGGFAGLGALVLGRKDRSTGGAVLVARGAIKANPRRTALGAIIVAIGLAAVVPPQLAERALVARKDLLVEPIRPAGQELVAAEDTFHSVPMTLDFAKAALRQEDASAVPTTFSFISYRGRKVELRAVDPSGLNGIWGPGIGLPEALPQLKQKPSGVLISRVMGASLGLAAGDMIKLRTDVGIRKSRILGEVEDLAWPSGTVYMHIDRYRRLFGVDMINVLAVRRADLIDPIALRKLRPLRANSGAELIEKIDAQMESSTRGLLAMRVVTLLAALVAVGGILSSAVFARRREWAVLRAMGMRNRCLFQALAIETVFLMSLGGMCGVVGGIVSFQGPTRGFLEAQGYVIGPAINPGSIGVLISVMLCLGILAAAIPAWLTARAPLSRGLSYE